MIFRSLQVNNVVYYKEATLDLDYKGVTAILGLNKTPRGNITNAAGKSILPSCISTLAFP